jgi:acetyl-CoA carboxylase biotin carboxyl carrier protein
MMDFRELKRLMEAMRATGTAELELEWDGEEGRPGGRVALRRAAAFTTSPALPSPAPVGHAAGMGEHVAASEATMAPSAASVEVSKPKITRGTEVTAPIVGTFYASPSPDAPAFVQVGDSVKVGQVLCIIEAMKLMNEIEAEVAGKVVEISVKNEDPVEFAQVLMRIEPA